MLIFTPNLTPQQQEQIANQTVAASKGRIENTFRAFLQAYRTEFDMFWRNPNCTPQVMATAWGTDGAKLFTNSAITKAYLLQISPNCLPNDYLNTPLPVTLNPDGTVTVG